MALRGSVAKRYAQAIAQIAKEQNSWDRWYQDLNTIDKLLSNRLLQQYLRSSRISVDEKVETVRRVVEGELSPEAMNLLRLLIERQRTGLAHEILVWYDRLADEARGVIRAQVTTAVPLTDYERDLLRRSLGGPEGRPVRLAEQVDPLIIGGIILRIGDQLIDHSLRTRLVALRNSLVRG
jgi:F-type H+-transporting ATPase subunit delta